ncbi:hypothetical protein T484DRAFT_2629950 [Baffinella frigidus]|nr:hypothetical protein T484DRAFT_2629950 [Cryptophyta sp. CCMP2293]
MRAVAELLRNGASPEPCDGKRCLALHRAAASGEANICKLLLRAAKPEQLRFRDASGTAPHEAAARAGAGELARELRGMRTREVIPATS